MPNRMTRSERNGWLVRTSLGIQRYTYSAALLYFALLEWLDGDRAFNDPRVHYLRPDAPTGYWLGALALLIVVANAIPLQRQWDESPLDARHAWLGAVSVAGHTLAGAAVVVISAGAIIEALSLGQLPLLAGILLLLGLGYVVHTAAWQWFVMDYESGNEVSDGEY